MVVRTLGGVVALLPVCILASAASLVFRYRRSSGEVCQQIKWVAFAASLVGALYLSTLIGSFLFAPEALSSGQTPPWLALLQNVVLVSYAGVPVAIGIAILKYRLYDIDILINRALVYGSLTILLAAAYAGGVIGLQYVFRAATGQGSTLAVVASTLAIAALFNPLRRRVQGFVDRRFYRGKYDASKTLEAFSSKLRDETDLDRLGDETVGVVRDTMQPAYASLWLLTVAKPDRSEETERTS